MPAGAKINTTLNGGYHVADDFDPEKLRRVARRREREEAERLREKGLDEKSKRVTFMTPFTIVCDSCSRHIAARTKVYVNVSEAPEKYLGRIRTHQLKMRCPMPGCNNAITLVVNPQTRSYDVSSGGKALGQPSQTELLERLKAEQELRAKSGRHATVLSDDHSKMQSNSSSNNNNSNNNNFAEMASFEDMQQMILEESARLDALGDNYLDEKSQVDRIRAARSKQQLMSDAALKEGEESEKVELHEKFQEARRHMRAMLKQDEKIANFGNESVLNGDDDDNEQEAETGNGAESQSETSNNVNSTNSKKLQAAVQLQTNNAFADALALFDTFQLQQQQQPWKSLPQKTGPVKPANSASQPTSTTTTTKENANKSKSLIDSMFSDDDDEA